MKPKVEHMLDRESSDTSYDDEDRLRFSIIREKIEKMDKEDFKKTFLKNKQYDFYKGFCLAREITKTLTPMEYEIVLAVVENIKEGYYKGGGTK